MLKFILKKDNKNENNKRFNIHKPTFYHQLFKKNYVSLYNR